MKNKTIILILFFALFASLTAGRAVNVTNANKILMQERKLPIYEVRTDEKVVALSFNCAWNIEDIDRILGILEKNKIRSSFFMTGEWVEKYPQVVKKIHEAGHDLASHGNTHAHMNELSVEACRQEIYELHKKVFELTGVEMDLFRPPYGEYNDMVIQIANEMGYYPIQWSVDSLDWKNYGVSDMTERVVNHKKMQNGAIILMHNGTKYTADALQGIIDGLRNKGYDFVAVSDLICRENYTINHEGQQCPMQENTSDGRKQE